MEDQRELCHWPSEAQEWASHSEQEEPGIWPRQRVRFASSGAASASQPWPGSRPRVVRFIPLFAPSVCVCLPKAFSWFSAAFRESQGAAGVLLGAWSTACFYPGGLICQQHLKGPQGSEQDLGVKEHQEESILTLKVWVAYHLGRWTPPTLKPLIWWVGWIPVSGFQFFTFKKYNWIFKNIARY